ncbi:MAG TPA: DUF4124 domain-containing protein [Steroidobacteraceae bacterium]|nr:DUF4124 domain-containing protein [Steroidobacteraceae bacterium]
MKRVLLCAVLIAWSGMASAVVYKWVDAQGKVQYGDRPPDGVHAEVVEMLGNHAARSTPSRPPSPNTSQAPKSAPRDQTVQGDGAKKTVDEDVAQTREKQCADAQDRYKKLIEGRKLYKTGTDGERQYLTSEEIDSERVNAKRELDSICNSST